MDATTRAAYEEAQYALWLASQEARAGRPSSSGPDRRSITDARDGWVAQGTDPSWVGR
jgi:hypothetical protein